MMCDSLVVTRLLRLLLALLLALPAAQAPAHLPDAARAHALMAHDMMAHDMMAHEMAGHHHGHGAPAPIQTAHHDCIGCIAPIDIRLYRPDVTPMAVATPDTHPANMAFLLASSSAPEPPPPRAFA